MTKIEWCDMTWNPVWGCLNNCPYCYAQKIAKRFHFPMAHKEFNCFGNITFGEFASQIKDFIPTWLESNFQKKFPKKPSLIFVNSLI
jgi:protein gp37